MNIRVDLETPINDGTEVVFRSPVDCSQITGLIVYYKENGNTASKEFALADAHGNNVGDIDHLFAENVVVKVILDLRTSMAFVQNADTNAYLEQRIDGVDLTLPHDLTEAEKAKARENIGAISNAVLKMSFINIDDRSDGRETAYLEAEARENDYVNPRLWIRSPLNGVRVQVGNIADGVADDDAVNVRQLNAAIEGVSGGGSSTMTVTIDEEGMASHTAAEIYAHIQSGGTAVLNYEGFIYGLFYANEEAASFGSVSGEEGAFYEYVITNDGVEAYDRYFIDYATARSLINERLGVIENGSY